MIRITAIAVCVLLTLSASGQRSEYTVVLSNGSRVSGTIVSDAPGYMDIRVSAPQVIRIDRSQVQSLEPLTYPVKKNLKTGGYFIRVSSGILSGKNANGNTSSLSFNLSNGYQFSNGIGIGLGTGMEELDVVIVPLYADLRFTPLSSGISPYLWIKSGYGFVTSGTTDTYTDYYSSDSRTEGGFLFGTGAGISMFTWKRTAINIGIGYRYQKITTSAELYWWGGDPVMKTVTCFNRLELHLGFVFM